MNFANIKVAILAGSCPEQMVTICNAAETMFYSLALVEGYGTDPHLTEFVDLFNEISALGEAAIRKVKATEIARSRQSLSSRDYAVAASIELTRRVRPELSPSLARAHSTPSPSSPPLDPPELVRQSAHCSENKIPHDDLRASFRAAQSELEAAADL